ncbi:MAG: TlpA family protein disulfide reductase [Oceanospirillaceae bacterium]|nr:TlpA family protein disulfide reductase [Oceanospirillaceae bacterium]
MLQTGCRALLLSLVIGIFSLSAHAAKAPAFILFDQAGSSISLDSYRGSGLILHFWGTWCPYCKKLQPGLERLSRKYKNAGLKVLAVSIRESEGANPEEVLKALNITFKTAVNGDKVAKMYGVVGTPSSYFISRDGMLLWTTHSADPWNKEFESKIRLILNLDQ